MSAVPLHQALFWPGDSPVSRSGEVDFEALAHALARAEYPDVRLGPRWAPGGTVARHNAVGRQPLAGRQPYSRAQHAVVASRAVDTLAALKLPQRRVLAMHAWLAEMCADELSGAPGRGAAGGKKRLALRFMELEALADVLARTVRWNHPRGRAGANLSGAAVPSAGTVDGLLLNLAGFEVGDRNRLALHALFCELLPSGLGPAPADAVLRAAGLEGEVPEAWVEILRFVRRMADETARRDLPGGARIERTGFPVLEAKIEPLGVHAAARLWLERHRVLTEARGR